MTAVSVGPLAMSVPQLLLIASYLLATLAGWAAGRAAGRNPERQLFALLVLGLVVARAAFVVRYFDDFRADLWTAFDIRDGGFLAPYGVAAVLVAGAAAAASSRALRKPLGVALTVGMLSWGLMTVAWQGLQQATRLPALELAAVDGAPVHLHDYLGKPVVINLWATWCPPCRREMPVLAEAQAGEAGVNFVFVNQGEGPGEIQRYLAESGLELKNVLIDPGGRLGQALGSSGLPTTLFYDASGQQVRSHVGALSRASLAAAMKALQAEP